MPPLVPGSVIGFPRLGICADAGWISTRLFFRALARLLPGSVICLSVDLNFSGESAALTYDACIPAIIAATAMQSGSLDPILDMTTPFNPNVKNYIMHVGSVYRKTDAIN